MMHQLVIIVGVDLVATSMPLLLGISAWCHLIITYEN